MSHNSYSGILSAIGPENVPLIEICDTVADRQYIYLMSDAVGPDLKATSSIIAEIMRARDYLAFLKTVGRAESATHPVRLR